MTRPIYRVKAEFFKTMGHPARIRILELLRDGERPVSELIPEVGIEPSHLSQQLAILRRANLVRSRKEGSSVLYSVAALVITIVVTIPAGYALAMTDFRLRRVASQVPSRSTK